VTVNSEIFSFEDTYVPEIYYYEDSSKVAEIIFYDMNCDGILDILPVMSDALIVHYSDDDQLRKNYSVAWCIYSDSQGNYQMAEGEMIARYTAFKTDDSAPGCLYADFMDYYTLEDGVPVLH
ncbi:MAG: hypothetical protein ACI4K7_05200, partial [Oscillospiraceae bacterium]